MLILLMASCCVMYNGMYLTHCIQRKNYRAAFGTAALISFVAAGTLLYMLGRR